MFNVFKGNLDSNADRNASTSQNLTNQFRNTSSPNPPSNQLQDTQHDDLDTDSTLNIESGNGDEDNGSNNIRNTRNSRRHDDGNIDFDFD